MKQQIYLDNAATTKVDEKVLKTMTPYFNKEYGNASSMHLMGNKPKEIIEKAREIIAKNINAEKDEIYFTSGGTESINFALKGLFWNNYPKKNHIITTKIEHDCVLKTCKWLESQGAKITYLNVDKEGFVNFEELKNSITEKTFLVSIIHANNEIGTIQNLEEIGKICRNKNVLFHADACQSFTKIPIDVKKQNLDLLTINSHKIHGPKGVGALYIKQGTEITPLFHGGGQEKGKRSGTENIPGVVGFAKAVEISSKKDTIKMEKLKNYLIKKILTEISNTKLNGSLKNRLCNNINISFNNIEGESIEGYLGDKGIYVSTGSACMSNTLKSSHVLKAINLTPLEANSSIRITISKFTTKKEIDYFLDKLKMVVSKLRELSPLVK
jgi:cysteine desulfurase